MKKIKTAAGILLSLLIILSCFAPGYAADTASPTDAATPSDSAGNEEEMPQIEYLDTSADNGKMYIYKGVEDYFVIYPSPEKAEPRFDIMKTVITVSEEGIVEAMPEKVPEYRFGNIRLKGLKYGKTTVTVTDPGSGLRCSVEVTVIPAIGYYIRNFFSALEYLPFFIFMWIAGHFIR